MSVLLPAAAAAAPLAGWSLHTLWMRRQLDRARRDPLTGLHTRAAFEKRGARLLRSGPCTVVVIDLDGFKGVNDTYGHDAGDKALYASAGWLNEWLADFVHTSAIAARLGGDEFALIAPTAELHEVQRSLSTLHRWLCVPVNYGRHRIPLGASIGAHWTGQHTSAELSVVLRRADEAMYIAKHQGGGVFLTEGTGRLYQTVNGRRAGRPGTTCQRTEGGAA